MGNDIIKQFVAGEIDIKAFLDLFNDIKIRNEIDGLMPESAVEEPNHPLWKKISFKALKRVDYSVVQLMCKTCLFDGSIGDNLNIWDVIKTFYHFRYPEARVTSRYIELHDLYLDVAGEYYEGPEVNRFIENIIRESLAITPKTKRVKAAREKIKEAFHVTGRDRPYWIQGAEWPMGEKSPMKYVKRIRKGEQVDYIFVDVDTGESRVVTQFY